MKNILYIAPYRQADGWGHASMGYLNSLIYACNELNYNLKLHPVYFSNYLNKDIPEYVRGLEMEEIYDFDIVIQKSLPQAIYIDSRYKNIGISVFEANSFKNNYGMTQPLNQLDVLLVPSMIEKMALETSGVRSNIQTISQPIPCEEIDAFKDIIKNDTQDFLGLNTRYSDYLKFYFIGTSINRKNIINLVKAFKSEVKDYEKVLLVIKTSEISNKEQYIKSIERELSSLRYHSSLKDNVMIITDELSRYDLLKIHHYCDIFICASKGEAFCRPLAEAMRFGNIPICVHNTGPTDYVNKDNGYVIKAVEEQIYYNGNYVLENDSEYEVYMNPSILEIKRTIRSVIEDFAFHKNIIKEKSSLSLKTTDQFTYESIGKKLCSLGIM
jgi:glycosyltransferase involved in cell wall biosynthesis